MVHRAGTTATESCSHCTECSCKTGHLVGIFVLSSLYLSIVSGPLTERKKWYIPSEKIGQNFWPPWNGFFGIHYHYWTWGNAFWPFLAPPDPWGGSGGVWGGQGGSRGPKIVTFLGATFGLQIGKFWIVWTENTLFSRFLAKNGPSGDQKWSFLGWNGWTQKCIFLKNTLFKLPENAP